MESKPDNTSRLLDAHGFLDRVIHQLQTLQSPHKDTLLSVLQYLSDHIRLTRSEIGALAQQRLLVTNLEVWVSCNLEVWVSC